MFELHGGAFDREITSFEYIREIRVAFISWLLSDKCTKYTKKEPCQQIDSWNSLYVLASWQFSH